MARKSKEALEKYKQTKKDWAKNNPDSVRNSTYKHLYGISLDDYNALFIRQNGCCALCNKHHSEFKRRLFIDHCHTTGRVRGLLCYNCNTRIGLYDNYKDKYEAYLKGSINEC